MAPKSSTRSSSLVVISEDPAALDAAAALAQLEEMEKEQQAKQGASNAELMGQEERKDVAEGPRRLKRQISFAEDTLPSPATLRGVLM